MVRPSGWTSGAWTRWPGCGARRMGQPGGRLLASTSSPIPRCWDATFDRFERDLRAARWPLPWGRELRWALDIDLGPLLPVDLLMAAQLHPSAHLTDDLFQSELGFVAPLNFPPPRWPSAPSTPRTRAASGRDAAGRALLPAGAPLGRRRSPPRARAADLYIAEYNVWMHHVLDGKERRAPSPEGHAPPPDLRDELRRTTPTRRRARRSSG